MVTAQQCKAYSSCCMALARAANVSTQRATVLMAMARSWVGLANQTERFEAIVKEETQVNTQTR